MIFSVKLQVKHGGAKDTHAQYPDINENDLNYFFQDGTQLVGAF